MTEVAILKFVYEFRLAIIASMFVCSIFLMIIEREYRTNSHEVESNDFPCTFYLKTKVSTAPILCA